MSKLLEYINQRKLLENLQLECKQLQAEATLEAAALRMSGEREDAKVWVDGESHAVIAMIPTVVPTGEILMLRTYVKQEQEKAREENATEIAELRRKLDWLSNTDAGRGAMADLSQLESEHLELRPQLKITLR